MYGCMGWRTVSLRQSAARAQIQRLHSLEALPGFCHPCQRKNRNCCIFLLRELRAPSSGPSSLPCCMQLCLVRPPSSPPVEAMDAELSKPPASALEPAQRSLLLQQLKEPPPILHWLGLQCSQRGYMNLETLKSLQWASQPLTESLALKYALLQADENLGILH